MNKLWAPWRIRYVSKPVKGKCIFCKAYKEKKDAANFVVLRSTHCFVILNTYPYNNGHVMVVPNRHIRNLDKLSREEIIDLFATTIKIKNIIKNLMHAEGFNIGINIGEVAGAGIKSHLHIHIVPRWNGDTSFMPAISSTKVISQSLNDLYKSLKKCLKEEKMTNKNNKGKLHIK